VSSLTDTTSRLAPACTANRADVAPSSSVSNANMRRPLWSRGIISANVGKNARQSGSTTRSLTSFATLNASPPENLSIPFPNYFER
jgi:hypothetical protein